MDENRKVDIIVGVIMMIIAGVIFWIARTHNPETPFEYVLAYTIVGSVAGRAWQEFRPKKEK